MKKAFCILLVLLFVCSAALCDERKVVNCSEWVTLRAEPSKIADRVLTVPLGEIVTECEDYGDFVYCKYHGMYGYILREYLEPVEESSLLYEDLWTIDGNDYTISARSVDAVEYELDGWDEEKLLWRRFFYAPAGDQFKPFDILGEYGGNLYVHNTYDGLYSIDRMSGRINWLLPEWEAELGSGCCSCMDPAGNLYVCGADSPDAPVCINANGRVLWRADLSAYPDVYWPFALYATAEGIHVLYDSYAALSASGQGCYDVLFGYNGRFINLIACEYAPQY